LSREPAARASLAAALTALLAVVLGHPIPDPRPYLAEGYTPLTHVSADNGFPSDHTLLAALLAGLLGWIDRRWRWALAVGAGLVGLGRLAVGAHHTLDVLGSVLIVMVAVGVAGWVRLPGWASSPPSGPPKSLGEESRP
jgi:undecaprenyl-diphosphatase